MILFCKTCKRAYSVLGEVEERETLLNGMDNFPCVTPLCRGRLIRTYKRVPVEPIEVPLHGFYRAIHGFGAPSGDPAPLKLSRETLLTKRIVEVEAEEIGQPKRTILKGLVMEDGTRLHFSRSTRGACLHYVEVPDAGVDDDGAGLDEVRAEDREEAG